MKEIFFIILSYLLGSIPFGFLITKIFTGENILEIGWKKTSGSNVYKNVGKWQGILTGILDLGKGYLAVYLAKIFSLPSQIQALCGVAAIFGHNWSIFLKFAGGRGIGTFTGCVLALYPKAILFSIFPTLVLLFLLNSPLATIFFLLSLIAFSVYYQIEGLFLFSLLSLFPIFLKRLSPISDISLKDKKLIKNRLLYDQDNFVPTRIEKWISKQ